MNERVVTITDGYKVQEIIVKTKLQRHFLIDIIQLATSNDYRSKITVTDKKANQDTRYLFDQITENKDLFINFEKSLEWIIQYIKNSKDTNDNITSINNPYNYEFISKNAEQDIVDKLGLNPNVTITER